MSCSECRVDNRAILYIHYIKTIPQILTLLYLYVDVESCLVSIRITLHLHLHVQGNSCLRAELSIVSDGYRAL